MIDLKDKNEQYLIIAIIIVLTLNSISGVSFLMYPFKLLATWVHEMGHGLTAEFFGGDFKKLVINYDTSGYALFSFPINHNFTRGLVASAGYMGTSIFGAFLLFFRKRMSFVRVFSFILGIIMVISLLVYIRSIVGWLFGVPFSALLIFIGVKVDNKFNIFFYNFIASQIALNAIMDIRVLFSVKSSSTQTGFSDAQSVANLWFGPYWLWAGLWLILSILLFLYTYLKPLSGSKKKIEQNQSTEAQEV